MIYLHYENESPYRRKNVGWSMAHEFGHCLNVADYYTHVKNGEPGFDIHDGSIMNYATCFARDCDIEKVIEAAESGRWTDWEAIE